MTFWLSGGWIGFIATIRSPGVVNGRANATVCRRAARAVFAVACAVLAVLFVFAAPNSARAQNCVGTIGPCFQGLGFLTAAPPGMAPTSFAEGVSPDGSTVVGWSYDSKGNQQAFSWSGGTMTGLSYLNAASCSPSVPCTSNASGVNGQGVIVGYSTNTYWTGTNYSTNNEAFTGNTTGIQGLGFLCPVNTPTPGAMTSSAAYAIASRANVPVGDSTICQSGGGLPGYYGEAVAFQNGVITPLGFVACCDGYYTTSFAFGVNSTGQVIVGQGTNATSSFSPVNQQAFTWQGGTLTALPFLNTNDIDSGAYAVNANGSVVVGYSLAGSGGPEEAVRWVNGVPTSLGTGMSNGAYAVNANGNVVVGLGVVGSCVGYAFRWTPVDGHQCLQTLLLNAGVNISGWNVNYVTGISANGPTIVGYGTDPNGHTQAWIARLPAPGASLAATHDFNADGKSDILWSDTSGDVAMWLMNGLTLSSGGIIATVPNVWSIVGQRDFNGDGKADILWRDTSGDVAMWLMNGTALLSGAVIGNVAPSSGWTIVGTGDFNGDGMGDILWRNTASGDVAIWLMNGTQIITGGDFGNVPLSSGWTIVGTGDFNGDGMGDILWRDTSGDLAMWFMNGTQVIAGGVIGTVPTVWTVVGTGDFNGDGMTDILWRDTAGDVAIWLMNGTTLVSGAVIGNVAPSSGWTIVETGDFNGDGKSDILWRNTASGDVAIWLMNGTQIISETDIANVAASWAIQGAGAD